MLRKLAAGLFIAALAATGIVIYRDAFISAQAGPAPRVVPDDAPIVNSSAGLKPSQKLPITQVVLFNSGVGYFHRSGEVEGDSRVDLQFSASDINDIIKSLVIHDKGGKPMPLRYDSQEPIEKS